MRGGQEMTEAQFGSPESIARGKRQVEIWRYGGYIAIVLFMIGNVFWAQYITRAVTRIWAPTITVTDVKTIGPTSLCPGDMLNYQYSLHVDGSGAVDVDASIWSIDPPQTAIYSMPLRAIFTGPTDTLVKETWLISPDLTARQVAAWHPGRYERRLAFRNVYEATQPKVITVYFSIRADCPK